MGEKCISSKGVGRVEAGKGRGGFLNSLDEDFVYSCVTSDSPLQFQLLIGEKTDLTPNKI